MLNFNQFLQSFEDKVLSDIETYELSIHSRLFKKFLISHILLEINKLTDPKIFYWCKEEFNLYPTVNRDKIIKILDDCVDKLNRYLPVYVEIKPLEMDLEVFIACNETLCLQKIEEKQGKNLKRIKHYCEKYGLKKILEEYNQDFDKKIKLFR